MSHGSTMTTEAAESVTEANGGGDLVERARSLYTLIGEHAAAAEEQGRLTDEVVQALHDNGLISMWVPKMLGGSELNPIQALDVLAELSYADPATGWVVMATSMITGTAGSYLGDEAAEELFGPDRTTVIAGQGTRPGTAVAVEGGYKLTGQWNFGSGMRHANQTHSLAIIEGTGEPRIFVAPVEDATLDQESWDVLGLRATGSVDYSMKDVFVPESYTHFAFSQDPKRGDLYRLGIINMAGICHTGWAIGVGRRALDELAKMAQAKIGRAGQMAENASFHEGFANAEAKYRAAKAFLYEVWRDVEDTIYAGRDLTVRQNTLIRLAIPHVTWTVHEVVLFMYKYGGTTALRSGTVQRLFRDIHAGTQHITSAPAGLQAAGRELAGLAEGQTWQLMNLVDPA